MYIESIPYKPGLSKPVIPCQYMDSGGFCDIYKKVSLKFLSYIEGIGISKKKKVEPNDSAFNERYEYGYTYPPLCILRQSFGLMHLSPRDHIPVLASLARFSASK